MFDFETGTLMNLANSTWYGENILIYYLFVCMFFSKLFFIWNRYGNDNGGRLEIYLNKPKPIGLHGYPIFNNIPDTYVKFTPTDKDADASQTIVPYLETQKVEPIVPIPLSGAGLYYKGQSIDLVVCFCAIFITDWCLKIFNSFVRSFLTFKKKIIFIFMCRKAGPWRCDSTETYCLWFWVYNLIKTLDSLAHVHQNKERKNDATD